MKRYPILERNADGVLEHVTEEKVGTGPWMAIPLDALTRAFLQLIDTGPGYVKKIDFGEPDDLYDVPDEYGFWVKLGEGRP